MENRIHASALTTFGVSPDGTRVQLNLADAAGAPAAVVLPVTCLQQLLMTIPGMIQSAMRNSSGDESRRAVFPLREYDLERGGLDPHGKVQYILTFDAGDGFRVSFTASAEMLAGVAYTVVEEVSEDSGAQSAPHLNG